MNALFGSLSRMTWVIARHEYLTNVRRPGFIFGTLFFPALGALGLLVAQFMAAPTQAAIGEFFRQQFAPASGPVGVVDASGLFTPIDPQFAETFTALPDEAAARAALMAETIRGFIVIPADYVATGRFSAYTRTGGPGGSMALDRDDIDPFLLHGLTRQAVRDTALRARILDLGRIERRTLTADAAGSAAPTPTPSLPIPIPLPADSGLSQADIASLVNMLSGFLLSVSMSMILFIALLSTSNYVLRGISEEKENRVMEVLLSSVEPADLLWGKVIGLSALGLTQLAVWAAAAVALSGGLALVVAAVLVALNPLVFALGAVYLALGFVLFNVLMGVAGSLGTSMRESQQIGGMFSLLASLPWMINGFMFANPNFILARILSWIPFSAPTMMMMRLPYGNTPVEDIVLSLAGLVISVPLVMWAGAKVFRASLLMYGKRLTAREIWQAIRS